MTGAIHRSDSSGSISQYSDSSEETRPLLEKTVSAGLAGADATVSSWGNDKAGLDLSAYSTWGNGLSAGRGVDWGMQKLFGWVHVPFQELTRLCDAGAASSRPAVRYPAMALGAISWLADNLIQLGVGLPGVAVTLVERLTINSGKALAGLALGLPGAVAALFGHTGLLDKAGGLLKDAWMTRGRTQNDALKQEQGWRAGKTHLIDRVLNPGNVWMVPAEVSGQGAADGAAAQQERATIPDAVKERLQLPDYCRWNRDFGYAEITGLSVNARVRWGSDGHVDVNFSGVQNAGSAMTAFLATFGIADKTFREARHLVGELVAANPGKVHVSGTSLGGAIAQYAGISTGATDIVCFNSLGLSPRLADEVVALHTAREDTSRTRHVQHLNANGDWLAHKLLSRYFPSGVSQLGERYKVMGEDLSHGDLRAIGQRLQQVDEPPAMLPDQADKKRLAAMGGKAAKLMLGSESLMATTAGPA